MSSDTYNPDRIVWPFSPAADELQLVFDEDGMTFTVDVDPAVQTPILLSDTNFGAADYDAFASAFEAQLNAAATGTYEVQTATPAGADVTGCGLAIVKTSSGSVLRFRLRFDQAATTIDPRLFGYAAGRTTTTPWSNDSSPADRVIGPYSTYYTWTAPRSAHDKRRQPTRVTFRSDSRVDSYSNAWVTDLRRRLQYRFVYSPHIWPQRGQIAAEASAAGLNTGDAHNGIFDLWEHLAAGGEAIIQHNDTSIGSGATDYELIKLHGPDLRDDFWAGLSDVDGGERYDLQWQVQVDPGVSNYAH